MNGDATRPGGAAGGGFAPDPGGAAGGGFAPVSDPGGAAGGGFTPIDTPPPVTGHTDAGGGTGGNLAGWRAYQASQEGESSRQPITINNTFNVEERSPAAIANAVTLAELKMGQRLERELVGI
jgi:hypothetical protein